MKKFINGLKGVLAGAIPTILLAGFYLLGFLIKVDTNNSKDYTYLIIYASITGSYILIIIANYIYSAQKVKHVSNPKTILDDVLSRKDEIVSKADELNKKVINGEKIIITISIVNYLIQLFFLMYAGSIARSYTFEEDGQFCFVMLALPALFLETALVMYIVSILFKKNEAKQVMYPETTKMIKEIFEEEGINKPVSVYLQNGHTNVSVLENKGGIIVNINLTILKFFTREEIKSIIYHEIAHYINDDVKNKKVENRYYNLMTKLLPGNYAFFFAPMAINLNVQKLYLDNIANIKFEIEADDYVLTKNVGNEYAAVAIKSFGLAFADDFPFFTTYLEFCKQGKWNQEVIDCYFKEYKDFYDEHKDFFIHSSKVHLERKFDTHPNVRQRVEKFATKEIDPSLIWSNEFDDDIKKLFEIRFSNVTEDFTKDVIDGYQKYLDKKNNFIEYDLVAQEADYLDIMKEAQHYGDFDFTIDIAKKLLEKNPNITSANYALGSILALVKFSDECLPYLYKVKDEPNSHLREYAINVLGEYLVITGREEERNKMREEAYDIIDDTVEMQKALELNLNDKLAQFTDNDVINKVIEIAKEYDDIALVSIGTKIVKTHSCTHVVVLIKNKYDNDKVDECYKKIFNYLDSIDGQYNLIFKINSTIPKTAKIRRKKFVIFKR